MTTKSINPFISELFRRHLTGEVSDRSLYRDVRTDITAPERGEIQ